ncbi:MAG: universal stress protein [Woeseiaceae bacterium]|nr:universal stress protein [Woeseiaceae bacterium]
MRGINTILADLDPSTDGQPALDRLRQVASDGTAKVCLFVCDNVDSRGGGLFFDERKMQESRAEYRSNIENWLAKCAENLKKDGIDATTSIAWHSPRYEAILEKAREINADLIIRSARKHSKLERLLISATDWELIRHAPQTVWLVKKRPGPDGARLNALAAVDPVHAEEKKVGLDKLILNAAADIAAPNNGSLHLFHAWQPGAAIAPAIAAGPHVPMPVVRVDSGLVDSMREERQKLLGELAREHSIADSDVHLQEGAVTDTLDDVVDDNAIDVVVAGGVSRGRFERLVIGSTAEAILESVDCDIVIVKSGRE